MSYRDLKMKLRGSLPNPSSIAQSLRPVKYLAFAKLYHITLLYGLFLQPI